MSTKRHRARIIMKRLQFNSNTINGNNKCNNRSAGRITYRLIAILVTADDNEHEG